MLKALVVKLDEHKNFMSIVEITYDKFVLFWMGFGVFYLFV